MSSGANGPRAREGEAVEERLDSIAAWLSDIDTRMRASEVATGDEKTAKELRRAIEALSKHDPKLEKRLTDRVDVLADRLATLAATVSTTAAALARKDGEIAALRKELEESSKRLAAFTREHGKSGVVEEVDRLRAAVRAVQSDRGARTGDARVEGLAAKTDLLNERIDTLGQTVATTAAGLAGRDGELATLRQRLEEVTSRIERTAVEVRRLEDGRGLGTTLDELRSAVDATAAGVAARETEIAAVKSRIDEAYSRIGTVVTELQTSIATLSLQVGALEELPAQAGEALEARTQELVARIDDVGERVTTLTAALENVQAVAGARDEETSALGARVEDVSSRIDALVQELRTALAELQAPGTIDPAVEARLDDVGARVTTLATALEDAVATANARGEQASALGMRVDDVSGRVDTLAQELRTALAELPTPGTIDPAVEARLDDVGARTAALEEVLATTSGRLEDVEATGADVSRALADAADGWRRERDRFRDELTALAAADAGAAESRERIDSLLDQLAARIELLERAHVTVADEVTTLSTALAEAHGDVLRRLDSLAVERGSAAEETTRVVTAFEREREAVRGRLEAVEGAHATTAVEIARQRETFEARLAEMSAALGAVSSAAGGSTISDRLLADLAKRVDGLEAEATALGTEIAEKAALWSSELDAVAERLADAAPGDGVTRLHAETDAQASEELRAEIARLSDAMAAERQALEERVERISGRLAELADDPRPASDPAPDFDQLRVSLEGLRMRLAASEQEVAALAGSRDPASRVEELARRLDALERVPVVVSGPADAGAPGDGRFRLELRALELRMEHAEAAARENREAVLVQLERLAARIEWRFQRLEAAHEATEEAVGGGRVVPIRPEL